MRSLASVPDDAGRHGWFSVPLSEDLSALDLLSLAAIPVDLDDDLLFSLIERQDWTATRRPSQVPPSWDWFVWLLLAGRGFGKTRVGAETMVQWAADHPEPGFQGACVAATYQDGLTTMFENRESGLKAVCPPSLLKYPGDWEKSFNRSRLELFLQNDGKIQGFSAEKPGRLRGPNHHKAWCDELAAWGDASAGALNDTTWWNLTATLRLEAAGVQPQIVVTTTPRANALTKYLAGDGCPIAVARYRGSSDANLANLASAYIATVINPSRGTRMGQQEIEAMILDTVGDVFDLGNLRSTPTMPRGDHLQRIRYWDLAATEPHDGNPNPDWTVGTRIAFDPNTFEDFWVEDSTWARLRPGARNTLIVETAAADREDFGDVKQWFELEGGSGGKAQQSELERMLTGIQAVGSNRPAAKKHVRAEMPAASIEQGRVVFVDGDWNLACRQQLAEMSKDDTHPHDDFVDTMSGAWAVMAEIVPKEARLWGVAGTKKAPN